MSHDDPRSCAPELMTLLANVILQAANIETEKYATVMCLSWGKTPGLPKSEVNHYLAREPDAQVEHPRLAVKP